MLQNWNKRLRCSAYVEKTEGDGTLGFLICIVYAED